MAQSLIEWAFDTNCSLLEKLVFIKEIHMFDGMMQLCRGSGMVAVGAGRKGYRGSVVDADTTYSVHQLQKKQKRLMPNMGM